MGVFGTTVVTGAAGSIGSAICAKLVSSFGTRLVAVDVKRDGLKRLQSVEALSEAEIVYYAQDASDWSAAASTIDEVAEEYGRIDALVTVAGGHQSLGLGHEPYWMASRDSIELDLRANLVATMAFVHPALRQMVQSRGGGVVCISSGKGLRGGPGAAAYSAAKAGVNKLVQATAVEAGPYGVRVNAVAPGGTEALWREERGEYLSPLDSVPLRRRTTPEDVGRAVAFLLSDEAAHITGTCMDLSGGTSLH